MQIQLPRLNPGISGREIFAVWTPFLPNSVPSFITDANALGTMNRQVKATGEAAFASTFFPVTRAIAARDELAKRWFTVSNDRSQAGAVHYDGSFRLLVDRRVRTNDSGGIPETMWLF